MMSNFGFISKKKVAREIAKSCHEHSGIWSSKEQCYYDAGAFSALTALCEDLNIKPMHLNHLAGGTGEMLLNDSEVEQDG